MRKLIYMLVLVVFFLLGLAFFLQNQQVIDLNYYGLQEPISVPLALLLLVVFAVGAVAGYFVSLIKTLKLRRNLSKANRTIRDLENTQV